MGPAMNKNTLLLWHNVVKALLIELGFERNQCVFHDKASSWNDRFEFTRLNAHHGASYPRVFRITPYKRFN